MLLPTPHYWAPISILWRDIGIAQDIDLMRVQFMVCILEAGSAHSQSVDPEAFTCVGALCWCLSSLPSGPSAHLRWWHLADQDLHLWWHISLLSMSMCGIKLNVVP